MEATVNTVKSFWIRKPNMKPPETVTLIDLEGNKFEYTRLLRNSFDDVEIAPLLVRANHGRRVDGKYTVYIGSTKIYESDNPLIKLTSFLNDQLTFIRNKMWETLAIYQATLGRYWEVPWYKVDYFKTPDGRESITKCKNVHLPSGYVGTVYQPTYSQFLKHYPDVFSKLTPWNGE